MATVVSATTRFRKSDVKRAEFLDKAHMLQDLALASYEQGRLPDSLEYAYQAALRLAGARVATSKVAARVRKPTNAWDQLRLVDEESKGWADIFSQYSRMRSHVASGIIQEVDELALKRLLQQVREYMAVLEGGEDIRPAVA